MFAILSHLVLVRLKQIAEQLINTRVPMEVGLGFEKPLRASVRSDPCRKLRYGRFCAAQIRFIDYDQVRQVQHRDLLQLQLTAVLRRHHQHRPMGQFVRRPERHRFLTGADSFDNHRRELGTTGQQLNAGMRAGAQASGAAPCGHTPHENAIVLRVNHRCPVAEKRAQPDNAGVMRENGNPPVGGYLSKKTENEFVDQSCLAGAARSCDPDDRKSRRTRINGVDLRRIQLGLRKAMGQSSVSAGRFNVFHLFSRSPAQRPHIIDDLG